MRFGLGRGLDHVGLDSVGHGAEPRATFALATVLFSLGSLPLTVIADRYLGRQRSVLAGAGLAVLGGLALTLPLPTSFGFAFILVGHAGVRAVLLSIVGDLHGRGDARRDTAFVWIGLAAWLGGPVGALLGWTGGASGALIVSYLVIAAAFLGGHRRLPAEGFSADAEGAPRAALSRADGRAVGAGVLAGAGVACALAPVVTLLVPVDPVQAGAVALLISLALTAGLLVRDRHVRSRSAPPLGAVAYRRIGVLALLGALALATEIASGRVVDRASSGAAGLALREVATASSVAILVCSIAVVLVLRQVDAAPRPPSGVIKIIVAVSLQAVALGLLTLGPAVATIAVAAVLLGALGQVLLVAVGLSVVSKLAPSRYAALAMACWLLATKIGSALAGAPFSDAAGDGALALGIAALAGLLAALVPRLHALMGGAEELPAEAGAPGPYR